MPLFSLSFFLILANLIIIPYSELKSNNLYFRSIIILDEKIPKECGINIKVENYVELNISILKKNLYDTFLRIEALSEINDINYINLKTNDVEIKDLVNVLEKSNGRILAQGKANNIDISNLFQQLIIDGGILYINDKKYTISGPIDTKVRLEYLFCTGEMFHPKYNR